MEISDLPDEILVQVHQWLPLPAKKEAVLVSRLWRKEGEHPSLWKWVKVTVYKKDDIGNLAIRRIKDIQEIKINPQNWDKEDWEAFFLATMELLSLKFIDGLGHRSFGALGTVERGIFARALDKLEVVELEGTPYEQIEELFRKMAPSTTIKTLHLEHHDLSRMEPDMFAMVLSRLEDVRLSYNNTTIDQMRAFFTQIVEKTCLKRLQLKEESVSHLEPGLFARALAKVEEVTLRNCFDQDDDGDQAKERTNDQIKALFTELSHGTQMKKLDLTNFKLSNVEPQMFATSMSRLETQGLNGWTGDVNHQMQALFTEMSLNTQTKKLSLDVAQYLQKPVRLRPGLVAGVLAKLEDVALNSVLSHHQWKAFFTEASLSTHLKTLSIECGVNLSPVDPEVFAQAMTRLEELTLGSAGLTRDHSQTLFKKMAVKTNLKKLEISYNSSSITSVNPQDLAKALNKLDEVKLKNTHVTHDQVLTFLLEMIRETKLKKLHLKNTVHQSYSLDPKILATALTKLKEVTLEDIDTRLTREKVEVVLTHVLEAEGSKLRKLQWSHKYEYVQWSHKYEYVLNGLNPETVRMLQDKLKGEFKLN